jgi:hypothetical protein
MLYDGRVSTTRLSNPSGRLVVPYDVFPDLAAVHLAAQLGTQQETPAQLPVQAVRLVRGRGEPMFEHDRDELSDLVGDGLMSKVVAVLGERFGQKFHRSQMRIDHVLQLRIRSSELVA